MSHPSIPLVIEAFGYPDAGGTFLLRIDGAEQCRITRPRDRGIHSLCCFELFPDSTTISLEAEPTRIERLRRGPRASVQAAMQSWALVDFASVGAPLRDLQRPFGQRIRSSVAALSALMSTYPDLSGADSEAAAFAEPVALNDVAAAEQRLGFVLPEDYRVQVTQAGPLLVGSAGSVPPSRLRPLSETIAAVGTVPVDARLAEWMQTGTALFIAPGHSFAALVYRPEQEDGAYWWFDAAAADRPLALKTAAGRCKTFAEAMIWVLARLLFRRPDSATRLALIDRSAPGRFRLHLEPAGGRDLFPFRLMPAWRAFD